MSRFKSAARRQQEFDWGLAQLQLSCQLDSIRDVDDLLQQLPAGSPVSNDDSLEIVRRQERRRRHGNRLMAGYVALCLTATGFVADWVFRQPAGNPSFQPSDTAQLANHCRPIGRQSVAVPASYGDQPISQDVFYVSILDAEHLHNSCSETSLLARVAIMNGGLLPKDGSFRPGDYLMPMQSSAVTGTAYPQQ